ncbi:hypothetical protein RYH80_18690 [Halobaculum sp. MBLA0147]|uniref:DUF7289 family protein n=1 Tax=Halobaculum sp. MBLA0147 TaxID=3079934 RepID=UPI003524BC29
MSNVVAALILLLITTFLVAAGGSAVTEFNKDTAAVSTETMENDMEQFEGAVHEAAASEAGGSRVEIARGAEAGQGAFTIQQVSAASVTIDGNVAFNTTTGRVIGESPNGGVVVYEMGAVFARTPDGSVEMVDPPRMAFVNTTNNRPSVTVPLYTLETQGPIGGTVTVRRTSPPDETDSVYANTFFSLSIQSPFYAEWAEYFRASAPNANILVFPDQQVARISITTGDGTYVHINEYDLIVQ